MGKSKESEAEQQAEPQTDDHTESSEAKDEASSRLTIRMDSVDVDRLESAVKQHRKQTGFKESRAGFARTLILIGLQNFERTGALVVEG